VSDAVHRHQLDEGSVLELVKGQRDISFAESGPATDRVRGHREGAIVHGRFREVAKQLENGPIVQMTEDARSMIEQRDPAL